MSSLLKLLWDHFITFSHPNLSKLVKNKKFALFSVSGSEEESIADSFYNDAKETEDFYKFTIIGTMRITGFEESGTVKDDEKAMKKAHDFGIELCEKANI
jgi:multimeric flavodoxin WrbA